MKLLANLRHDGYLCGICVEVNLTKESLFALLAKWDMCQDGTVISLELRADDLKVYTTESIVLDSVLYDYEINLSWNKEHIFTSASVVIENDAFFWRVVVGDYTHRTDKISIVELSERLGVDRDLSVPENLPQ